MKKTGKKFLMLMLTLVMIFVSAVPGFAEESTATITIASPTKIIAAKDSETVLRIPFTATLDGSTAGFAKTAKDSSGNAFYADQVWFDDSYMYFTNAINTSTTESKVITVTCTKGGATATQTITVYPYIEHDFSIYASGTMLTTAITPATSSYAWSDGSVSSNEKARVSEYSSGVNYLNPWTSPYVRLCFTNVDNLVSDKGDVSVEIDLFKADENEKSDFVGFRSNTATNTEYFFSFVKNADGSFNLYDKSAKTTLLKENVKVGDKVSVRIAINYATQKYRIYVNGSATPAVGDTAFTYTYTNSIVFTAPITRFAVYSGEEVTPLSYTINDEFTGWTAGDKYYKGSTATMPTNVNNIIVDTGNESSAYFAKTTKDGADVLESYFAAASTTSTQNVRYSGSGIGNKFLVEYKIFIENNGIRIGASAAPNTAAGSKNYWPEIFYFENDGYFRSNLLTGDSYLGSYRLNEWNTVQLAADTTTGTYSIYLNGYPMVTDAVNEDLIGYVFNTIRHNVIMRSQNGNAHKSYLDYFKVANIGEGLDINNYRTDFTFDGMLVLNQDVLIGANEIDARELISAIAATGKSVIVKNAEGTEVTAGKLADGYKIYVTSANRKNTCCYAVSKDTYKLYLGSADNTADDGTVVSHDVALTINKLPDSNFAAYVIVAEYNGDQLVKVSMNDVITDGKITVNYTPESNDNSIMAFAWESFDTLKPLISEITVE